MIKRIKNESAQPFSHLILYTILIGTIIFIILANYLKIDVITRATGKVVPSKHLQVVENLEGGIVKSIYVKVGDIVKKDQVLVQLDDVRFKSAYEEGKQKELLLKIRVAMLSALAGNKKFIPDKTMTQTLPTITTAVTDYYNTKQQEVKSLRDRYDLLQKEINLTKPLVKEGVMSTVELLRLERDLAGLQGSISDFYSKVLNDLNDSNDKLAQIVEENKASLDRLQRTTVRSPLYGIVKTVYVTTVGGVIKADDPIVDIIPLDDTLLIETLVLPEDIAFVHKDQKAEVKITAYDFTIYGDLQGYVENMSTDTFKDENGVSYYRIWVRTYRNYLEQNGKKYLIIPGMIATVDILTGKRTLMHYILKPFMRVRESALIER